MCCITRAKSESSRRSPLRAEGATNARDRRESELQSERRAVIVTVDTFRLIALSFPEAVESSHMEHPDFRVRGRIFATLGYPDKGHGMVKLTPEQQRAFVRAKPGVFAPAKGGWGLRGATTVRLASATSESVRPAMNAAWLNVAPKRLALRWDSEKWSRWPGGAR